MTEPTPLEDLDLSPWKEAFRGIKPRVLDQYGIIPHKKGFACLYRDEAGEVVAQKFRGNATEGAKAKLISWRGDHAQAVGLGEHLASPVSHQAVCITEGELDAASVYDATNGRIAGVSVPDGAQSAATHIKARLDWYLRFKVVYLALDMDEPGREATQAICDLLPPGRVRMVTMPRKDANATLQEVGGLALKQALDCAKEYRPGGIVSASEFTGLALAPPQRTRIGYPFAFWSRLVDLYDNQLVIFVAGSGIGKSSIMRAICLGLMEAKVKCGWIGLEETVDESIYRFVGAAAGVELHHLTDYDSLTKEQLARLPAADEFITKKGRLELFDHFGSLSEEVILNRMQFMAKSLGCKVIFLDHLSILSSGLARDTAQVDALVTKVRAFCANTRCTVIAANHLSRNKDRNFEDGDIPEMQDIRGSHAIAQLSDTIWAAGRKRGTDLTHIYCRKNRMRGRLGYAGSLEFVEATQQFAEVWQEPGEPSPFD